MYHAGLEMPDRIAVQEGFMNNDFPVVVATNAFGMGVDKDNVRCIVHWEFPSTVEAYYQEIGRAGRDGKPSRVVLLYRDGDRRIHDFFIRSAYPSVESIERIWRALHIPGTRTVWMGLKSCPVLSKMTAACALPDHVCMCCSAPDMCGEYLHLSAREKVQLLARSTWPNKDPSGIRGQVLQG